MEIERKPFLERMAQAVLQALADLERGQVLTHEVIETTAGIGRYTEHWHSIIKKVKDGLLDSRGIALLPVISIGYRLCTPAEQIIEVGRMRQRRALRQIRRGLREVAATPNEELTVHQQTLKALTLQGMARQRRAILGEVRRQTLFRREKVFSRPQTAQV